MTVESAVVALTTQTTQLLDTCVSLRSSAAASIAAAVAVSTNASQIPLVDMARNLVDTQTLFVSLIAPRNGL